MNGTCKSCNGPCPKTCEGVIQINNDNVEKFKDCVIIDGSITILDSSFKGYSDVDEKNIECERQIESMPPEKLEVFSSVRTITGYINIQAKHENFKNLSFLR